MKLDQIKFSEVGQCRCRRQRSKLPAKLGNACHALEDSFALGHAEREPATSDTQPGGIKHVKLYAGDEKENYSHHDKAWEATAGGLGFEGRLAKNAVKGLIVVIFDAVYDAKSIGKTNVSSLSGWTTFRNNWLRASPHLSKQIDEAYDLIDKFYSGIVWGNTQTALNFVEDGLAKAIYQKFGTDTDKIYKVFHRLNEHHTSDVDDVAEILVGLLRKETTPRVSRAIANDSRLRKLLIKVMDEGWTSSGEQKCIDYLKKLTR